MASDEIGLLVAIRGLGEFRRSIGVVESDISRVESTLSRVSRSVSLSNLGRRLTEIGNTMMSTGRTLGTVVTGPVALATGTLVSAGIRFEDSFADIGKTVAGVSVGFEEIAEAAQSQLGITITTMDEARQAAQQLGMAFGDLTPVGMQLREEFRRLGQEIPLAYTELNRLGGVVGQLGVQTPEAVLEVTRTVAMLGTTTNMSAEEAAMALMHFANIMGITADQIPDYIHRMGSAVVDLGNNSVSTESEILNMAMRLAGAGRIAGMSSQDILGFATSLTDMGIRAEMGGTALSRTIQNMMFAVADGGEQLETFAILAGQTAQEFADNFRADPVAAVENFLERIVQVQEEGMPGLRDALEEIGLSGVRVRDVMNRLGGNLDLVRRNIQRANTAWRENIALENEAEKRYGTLQSQLQLLRNRFSDLGVEIYDLVKGTLANLIEKIGSAIEWFKGLDDNTKRVILTVAGIAAAIGPVLLVLGFLISSLGTVVTFLGTTLPAVIGAVLSPIGLLAAAIAGIIAVVGTAIGWDNIFNFIQEKVEQVRPIAESFLQTIRDIADAVTGGFLSGLGIGQPAAGQQPQRPPVTASSYMYGEVEMGAPEYAEAEQVSPLEGIASRLRELSQTIGEALSDIGTFFSDLISQVDWSVIADKFAPLIDSISRLAQELIRFLEIKLDQIIAFVEGFIEGFSKFDISGEWEKALTFLRDMLAELGPSFDALINSIERFTRVSSAASDSADSVRRAGSAIGFIVSTLQLVILLAIDAIAIVVAIVGALIRLVALTATVISAIKGIIEVWVTIVMGMASLLFNIIVDIGTALYELIVAIVNNLINGSGTISERFTALWQDVQDIAKRFFDAVINDTANFVQSVIDKFFELLSALVGPGVVDDLKERVMNALTEMSNSVIETINNLVQSVVDKFNELYQALVGGSIVLDLRDRILEIFTEIRDKVQEIIAGFIDSILNRFDAFKKGAVERFSAIRDSISNITGAMQALYNWLAGHIGQILSWIGAIGTTYAQTDATVTNSPQTTIQTAFEMLHDWVNTHPIELQVAVPSQSAVNQAMQGVVLGAMGGSTIANVSYGVNIQGVPMTSPADAVAEMNRAFRLLRTAQV